ncbi:hypothetical protein [Chryseobacterium proteolyticum]|uniref:hypothetical protein n=1 Tax=Chryseobacterium proteolyticum TaxID=118127 RepID=UPI003983062C
MKKLYLILFVSILPIFKAQILNIPDPNFKSYLLSANNTNYIALDINHNPVAIDLNGDNEIQASEASLIKTLDINGTTSTVGSQIGDITGIKSFTNLTKLSVQFIPNNNFTSFDVSGMTSLTELFAAGYYLSAFNVDNCTGLKKLNIQGGNFQTLTLNIPSLTHLSISEYLNYLNFQGCPNIKVLNLERVLLSNINLSGINNLEEVTISSYGYSWLNNTINISGCNDLKKNLPFWPGHTIFICFQ